MEIAHIPVIALIHLGFIYIWNLKVRNRAFRSKQIWIFAIFGSLFNVWGLDVIQREFTVDTVLEMIELTGGCWIVFVLATNAKYLPIYGWSKREFWLDYGGELIGFMLAGALVFAAT